MLDINNFSNAQSQILCNILNDQAFVFVIPLYQREYSWEDNELNKLFYDTTAGFNSLTTATNEQLSATFLGSVIAYNAVSKDSSQSELGYPPGTLKIVIDGQQRLTSLLIFLCVLHERIIIEKLRLHCSDPNNELSQQFPDLGYDLSKDFYKDCSEWLDIEHNILEQITDCLFSFNKHARPGFGYYPKMFREAKDKWSKKDSFYGSQIASLLSKYWKESREIYDGESFNFDAIKAHKEDLKKGFFLKLKKRNKSNLVENAYSVLRERIAELFGKESDQELEIPDFDNLYRSKVLHKIDEAWDYSKSVEEILLNGQDLNLCNYIRFISYVSYVINRICLTVITTTNEDYAFDIFESLNTTGTPLTAYETFKPLVINYAGKDFLCREEKSLLDKIDGYLGKKGNKEQITSTMLIAFANCYSGEKLSRTLKSQRAYLRKYPSLEQDEKDNFLKTLSATALTICNYWDGDVNYYKLDLGEDRENFEDAKVCLKFLNSTKTSVILPLLTRFYQKMEASAFSKESITEFNKVVKAITAFFVFYRSSRKTTDGIDEVFRKILSDDFCVTKSQGKFGSLESLKAKFIEILKEKDIYDKDNWIKKSASIPIFEVNKSLTRFILLAAEDCTVIDKNDDSFRIKAKVGVKKYLTEDDWLSPLYNSIEHIAPQTLPSSNESIDQSLYVKDENEYVPYNFIGNLMLLPSAYNSSLSNKEWKVKKIVYKILGSQYEQSDEDYKNSLKNIYSDEEINSILGAKKKDKFIQFAETISNCKSDVWNKELVLQRGEHILDLAWQTLSPWLYEEN